MLRSRQTFFHTQTSTHEHLTQKVRAQKKKILLGKKKIILIILKERKDLIRLKLV